VPLSYSLFSHFELSLLDNYTTMITPQWRFHSLALEDPALDPSYSIQVLGEAHPDWEKLERTDRKIIEKDHRDRRMVRRGTRGTRRINGVGETG